VVQLSGFVESAEVSRRAEEIAKGVQGVQSVKNDLRVNPS
jgi:hyperosmotically inducible protein